MSDPEPPKKDFVREHPVLVVLLLTPVALLLWLLVTIRGMFAFVQ